MTSHRKIEANRENAKRSKGAITSVGRARSAMNAFRHGLSLPVHVDPALAQEVDAVVNRIAGPGANEHRLEIARRVVEAQLDLRRVRCAIQQLFLQTLSEPFLESRKDTRKKINIACYLLNPKAPYIPFDVIARMFTSTPQGPYKFAVALSLKTKEISALSRYEKRALSRRNSAIRELDSLLEPQAVATQLP